MRSVHMMACVAALSLGVPASAQIAVTGSSVLERRSQAGDTYTGTIILQNTTDEEQEARLAQADYDFTADGSTRFDEAGTHPRSNARWIRFLPASVTIPPRMTASATFTVQVPPQSETLTGTYWSVVIVETVDRAVPPLTTAGQPRNGEIGLRPTVRYAVQVATHMGETGEARLEFAEVRAAADTGGGRVLELDVINAGERALRPVMSIELYDAGGELVSRQKAQRGLMYPGTSVRQRFVFGALPAGEYTALILADAGGAEVFGAQLRIKY